MRYTTAARAMRPLLALVVLAASLALTMPQSATATDTGPGDTVQTLDGLGTPPTTFETVQTVLQTPLFDADNTALNSANKTPIIFAAHSAFVDGYNYDALLPIQEQDVRHSQVITGAFAEYHNKGIPTPNTRGPEVYPRR